MSTDRELLELAAKAFWGEEIDDVCSVRWLEEDQAIGYTHGENQDHNGLDQEFVWNPLEDDGDTFRLETKMSFTVVFWAEGVEVGESEFVRGQLRPVINKSAYEEYSFHGGDKGYARRKAAVKAAAKIGRGMEGKDC